MPLDSFTPFGRTPAGSQGFLRLHLSHCRDIRLNTPVPREQARQSINDVRALLKAAARHTTGHNRLFSTVSWVKDSQAIGSIGGTRRKATIQSRESFSAQVFRASRHKKWIANIATSQMNASTFQSIGSLATQIGEGRNIHPDNKGYHLCCRFFRGFCHASQATGNTRTRHREPYARIFVI